jgi:hypothetical protein
LVRPLVVLRIGWRSRSRGGIEVYNRFIPGVGVTMYHLEVYMPLFEL